MISVLLVDPQAAVRRGLRALLDGDLGATVVGEAGDEPGAVRTARATRPDVVLMALLLPGGGGLEATRRIVTDPALARTRVLLLAPPAYDAPVLDAVRAGASGLLLTTTPPDRLLEALRTVAEGEAVLAPSAARTLIRGFRRVSPRCPRPHPDLHRLTGREREVVGLVADGLSNREIGERLTLSPATARTHVSRAMVKLGARDRAQLVAFAYQSGLA